MNKLLSIICLSFISITLCAQKNDLIPGYEYAEWGTVYISNADSVQGVIAFSFIKNNELTLINQGGKETKYKAADIKGFRLRDSKLDFLAGKWGIGYNGFLQVLTPENKKAKIVKTFSFTKGSKIEPGKEPEGGWITSLYLVSKNANYEAVKKIGEAIKDDCPELSAKIARKEKGYFANLMSGADETLEAYKNIANEIEAGCK